MDKWKCVAVSQTNNVSDCYQPDILDLDPVFQKNVRALIVSVRSHRILVFNIHYALNSSLLAKFQKQQKDYLRHIY